MTNDKKQTDHFDTDKAWKRFEKLAAQEPAAALWEQTAEAEGNKNGAMEMKHKGQWQTADQPAAAAGSIGAAHAATTNGTWRTERPVKRLLRRLTAGAAAAVLVVSLVATPIGDKAMAAILQTFRMQHMVGVGISADDMATISSLLEHGSPDGERSFSLAQYGSLSQSGGGESRTVSWEEAEQLAGFTLLHLENASAPDYQPATTLTFTLNVKPVNRLLTRLGSSTVFPAEADGHSIRLHIPDGFSTKGELLGKPVSLLQFGKPELTMEGGIDASDIRDAILGLPVLPNSLRTKLAAISDWESTLPVPARDGVTTSFQLNGHDAVMTMDGEERFLFWLDGDRIGVLRGDSKDFRTEASFRTAAEGLVQP